MAEDPRLRFLLLLLLCFHGVESSFPSYCSDVVCNGVLISYPFWKIDDGATTNGRSTSGFSCGYRGFGLSCPSNDTDPVLALPSDSYYVKQINYSSHSVTLVDIDVVGKTCPRAKHNLTVDTLPLNYNPVDKNITFFYNCSIGTGDDPPPVGPIPCLGAYKNKASYAALGGTPAAEYSWAGLCEEVVVATVQETEVLESDLIDKFAGAMNTGFVLDWSTAKDCGACEFTRGRCGFNSRTSEFLCFCDDGSIHGDGSNTYCKGKVALESLQRLFDKRKVEAAMKNETTKIRSAEANMRTRDGP